MADHIQNIECKVVFFISVFSSEYWVTTHCFLFSYLRSMRSMVKHLLVMELNQSLMLLHTEKWWGLLGCFLDFVTFQIVQTKISASAGVFAVIVVLLILSFPPAIAPEKFWISLPKRNSHSFECIRTILLCRQTFSLQLYTQKRQKDWDFETQTKRSNHVEKTNCSCTS